MYVYVCVYVCMCVCLYMYVCMNECMYLCMHVCMCTLYSMKEILCVRMHRRMQSSYFEADCGLLWILTLCMFIYCYVLLPLLTLIVCVMFLQVRSPRRIIARRRS